MPTPFPGMDPYLEQPELWPDIHNSLIPALRNDLAPKLRPRYYLAEAEVETGPLVGRADVAVMGRPQTAAPASSALEIDPGNAVVVELPMPDQIRETFLEVRETGSNKAITVVEILSPTNKRPRPGRNLYLQTRAELLAGQTHLVEIDLLRVWQPMPMRQATHQAHYRILVSRAEQRPRAHLFPFNLRQPIPTFALPLRPGDQEPTVNLGHLLHALYDQAGYDLRLDYGLEPPPPLSEEDIAWVEGLLRQAGLR